MRTREDLLALATPKVFERGRAYWEEGAVETLTNRKGHLYARVQGSEDYDVTFEVREDALLEPTCTCPYEYGGWCKHQVAVALAWLEAKPAPRSSPDDLLANATREELLDLVIALAETVSGVAEAIEERYLQEGGRDGDNADLRRQLQQQLQKMERLLRERRTYRNHALVVQASRAIIERAQGELADAQKALEQGHEDQRPDRVFAIAETLIQPINGQFLGLSILDEYLSSKLFQLLDEGMSAYLLARPRPAEERVAWTKQLFAKPIDDANATPYPMTWRAREIGWDRPVLQRLWKEQGDQPESVARLFRKELKKMHPFYGNALKRAGKRRGLLLVYLASKQHAEAIRLRLYLGKPRRRLLTWWRRHRSSRTSPRF